MYKVAALNELYSELGEKNHVSNVIDYDKDRYFDSVMYEISSWGKKYYISQYELRQHVNKYLLGSIVTNVCYIKEEQLW